MFEVRSTERFQVWFGGLGDARTRKKIMMRVARLRSGQFGDAKYFDGIGELRIHHGPGYRLYFVRRGGTLVILLCGGDKSSQSRDIEQAKALAEGL